MADKASRNSGGNQPISRHPLFPAIVALWFGALFGLAGIAIEPALLEQIVVATGIDSLIPMAAPPLGATARVLMALAMTGLGGVVGLLVARRIARPETSQKIGTNARRRDAASIATDAPGPDADRTAAAKVPAILPPPQEQPAKEADRIEARPSPAVRETSILDVSEFELDSFDAVEDPAPKPPAPPLPAPTEERDAAGGSLFDAYSREITRRTGVGAEETSTREESAGGEFVPVEKQGPEYPSAMMTNDDIALPERAETDAAHRIATAELDALSQVELLERLALAIERRRSEAAHAPAIGAPVVSEAPPPVAPEPEPERLSASKIEPEPQAGEPEHEPPAFEPSLPVLPRLGAAPAEAEPETPEAAPQMPRVPAALRPVGHHFSDADEDEDEPLPGYVPPRHIVFSPDALTENAVETVDAAFDDQDAESEEDEGEVLEEGYSSLLDLSRPAGMRQPFLHVDETTGEEAIQPVAIFPGEEAAAQAKRPFDAPDGDDAEETEKALRAALATLKRMSGAA